METPKKHNNRFTMAYEGLEELAIKNRQLIGYTWKVR